MERFKNLINAMPEDEHVVIAKKSSWNKHIDGVSDISKILRSLFKDKNEVEISRNDLVTLSSNDDMRRFIIATILWGYPSGMRGNNFSNIINEIDDLITVLNEAKFGVSDWSKHYKKVKNIKGLGLSTYTKFLYFLGVKVNDYPALILDYRIIKVMNKGLFVELDSLKKLTYINAIKEYPNYLKVMNKASGELNVKESNLEMFLFEFGLNLKLKRT